MRYINFGSLDKRELALRFFGPYNFHSWWRYELFSKYSYRWWWVNHSEQNHRCYCPVGRRLDFSLAAFGFGFVVFYSRYGGDVPCDCDKALDALDAAEIRETPK